MTSFTEIHPLKKNHKNYQKIIFWFFFILCLFFVLVGYFSQKIKNQKEILARDLLTASGYPFKTGIAGIVLDVNEPPAIDAFSYLVGEVETGKLLAKKNSDFHLSPASLSKLITAMVVFDNFPFDKEVPISVDAVSAEGEEGGLIAGESLKVLDLLKILLVSSSNDAAAAFSELFEKNGMNLIALMNQKAKVLDLSGTGFFNASGVDREGNFTTAEDLFKTARNIYLLYPLIGEITKQAEVTVYSLDGKITHHLINTNVLAGRIENLWGGKTGSTPTAKDCLLTIYDFNLPKKNGKITIAIVVLNSSDRFSDTLKLYNWIQDMIEKSQNG
ncbi:MAG: hypothetical protein WC042_02415 [Candidatus Paceibacterota bacterium]|jgi:D-alanyl-D-alanine carboxypeptidase